MTERLLDQLNRSTCNFLATDYVTAQLEKAGFTEIYESEIWKLEPNGKYYVTKNDSAVFAFITGSGPLEYAGARIIAAHTDSPCFKIKPGCEIYGEGGVVSLNVEKYGGGILYTWFDRPLSVSGRVVIGNPEDPFNPRTVLVDLERPVATIPHLAIHFNRGVNEGNPISVQKDMKPVIGYFAPERIKAFKENGGVIRSLLAEMINNDPDVMLGQDSAEEAVRGEILPESILDYELCLYPAEPAALTGLENQYFQSARIDDLSMAFAGMDALLAECENPCQDFRILALFDNEETGSGTKQGAHSPVLKHIIERICLSLDPGCDPQLPYVVLANSFMVSADDAHGWHPNYPEKMDPTNHPVLGGGPVVKINANCKYMSDAHGAAVFRQLCENAGVTAQYFVNHSDVAGGSTLGNISSVQLDIPGVDVGCAIWAMHSARETAALSDHFQMIKVLRQFLK